MLSHTDLKKGAKIILEGEPYEILDAKLLKKAQRQVVIQTKIKNLVSGNVLEKNFHQGDVFEEAELLKIEVKFLYSHRGHCCFSEKENPAKRFELSENQTGEASKFLKPGQIVEGLIFRDRVIKINLPIKINLKVVESPPGIRGDRAQAGTKMITLETGTKIAAPLFIKQGDVIEINTETGQYVRRI